MIKVLSNDIKAVREILCLSQGELARMLGTEQNQISKYENEEVEASKNFLENFYRFVYKKNIKLNVLKEVMFKNQEQNTVFLVHNNSQFLLNNNFSNAYITSETLEHVIPFVSVFKNSNVYALSLDKSDLIFKEYGVDQEWMLTIAYYRGTLDKYNEHQKIKKIIKESRNCDVIVAPIADNRMFSIVKPRMIKITRFL